MAKTHKYTGILGNPDPLNLDVFAPEMRQEAFETWYLDRIGALFADCGVDLGGKNGWAEVAFVLAQRHVPGFGTSPHKRRGPKPKTSVDDNISVLGEMLTRISRGQRLSFAAQQLAKARRRGESSHAIERRYRRILAKAVKGLALVRSEGGAIKKVKSAAKS